MNPWPICLKFRLRNPAGRTTGISQLGLKILSWARLCCLQTQGWIFMLVYVYLYYKFIRSDSSIYYLYTKALRWYYICMYMCVYVSYMLAKRRDRILNLFKETHEYPGNRAKTSIFFLKNLNFLNVLKNSFFFFKIPRGPLGNSANFKYISNISPMYIFVFC